MIYLDTNILVSLFTNDSNSATAREWYSQQQAPLAISTWGAAEFFGHIGLRTRKAELSVRDAGRIVEIFECAMIDNFIALRSEEAALARAAAWLRATGCTLQAADALHLGIALQHKVSAIATFDQRFAATARKLFLPSLKVICLPEAPPTPPGVRQKMAHYRVGREQPAIATVKNAQSSRARKPRAAPRSGLKRPA